MKNPYKNAHDCYNTVQTQIHGEVTSPHELVNLLLQGVRSNIAIAIGNIERKQISEKGSHISRAISIIEGLKSSLDHEHGGEIAGNLDRLYDYIQQVLFKANLKNDPALLMEANQLISEIHQAWMEIKLTQAKVSS